MGPEIIQHHHLSRPKLGYQHLLGERLKHFPVHGRVEDATADHALDRHGRDGAEHFPVPVRGLGDDALATRAAGMGAGHVGRGPEFINENQVIDQNLGELIQ